MEGGPEDVWTHAGTFAVSAGEQYYTCRNVYGEYKEVWLHIWNVDGSTRTSYYAGGMFIVSTGNSGCAARMFTVSEGGEEGEVCIRNHIMAGDACKGRPKH